VSRPPTLFSNQTTVRNYYRIPPDNFCNVSDDDYDEDDNEEVQSVASSVTLNGEQDGDI
jgi:hypothetical protein